LENKLCEDEPEEIAKIFLMTEGVNKETLGLFFGSPNEKNQMILESFCRLLDFRNMEFDKALRLFLSRFRLPGEAQQIDRVVTHFSTCYQRDNPLVFKDEDSPYILTYAAIMLNVDSHNNHI
jgi:Sec7-like guanine-nucleotide exchange factor